jgi:hypothetical protein
VLALEADVNVRSTAFQSSWAVRQPRTCGSSSSEMVDMSILRINWSWRNHCTVSGSVEMVMELSGEVEVYG